MNNLINKKIIERKYLGYLIAMAAIRHKTGAIYRCNNKKWSECIMVEIINKKIIVVFWFDLLIDTDLHHRTTSLLMIDYDKLMEVK
jgi:hypothetical protein